MESQYQNNLSAPELERKVHLSAETHPFGQSVEITKELLQETESPFLRKRVRLNEHGKQLQAQKFTHDISDMICRNNYMQIIEPDFDIHIHVKDMKNCGCNFADMFYYLLSKNKVQPTNQELVDNMKRILQETIDSLNKMPKI